MMRLYGGESKPLIVLKVIEPFDIHNVSEPLTQLPSKCLILSWI